MAVYKRTYKGYAGSLTPEWSRFLILPRYSYSRLFQSKFLLLFLAGCFFFPLAAALFIYLAHNLSFLKTFNIQAGELLEINPRFFLYFCDFQGAMAYLLTAFVGPSLISPDLTNNALPLYFSRPFTRAEYLAGKMSVLLILLSLITWIPGLILFAIQGDLAGWAVDQVKSLAGRRDRHGSVTVDYGSVADRHGHVGLGEMEGRGGRVDPRRLFRGRGLRPRDQRNPASQERHADRFERSQIGDLGLDVSL